MTTLSGLYGGTHTVGYDPVEAFPQLLPDLFSLDDTNTGVSRGSAFSSVESLDFDPSSDGSVWISVYIPYIDSHTPKVFYNLDGSDNSTTVTIQTEYWLTSSGETIDSASPTGTNSDDISTGTDQDNQVQTVSLSSIPTTNMSRGDFLTLKITRLGSSDTYSGTFQLIYMIIT